MVNFFQMSKHRTEPKNFMNINQTNAIFGMVLKIYIYLSYQHFLTFNEGYNS